MRNLIPFCLIALLLPACTPPAPPTQAERQKEFARCFRAELDPTDEQVKALEEKVFQGTDSVKAVADALRKETEALDARLESVDAKDEELLEGFRKVGALRARMSEDHFRRMLLLRSVLSDAQKRNFLACKRKLGPPSLPHE